MNNGSDHTCGGGSRHTHKIFGAARCHVLHVETSKAPRATKQESEATEPAETADPWILYCNRTYTPGVGEDGGCNAEADNIGERIKLHPEFGVGAGHSRDCSVQGVEHPGEADGLGSVIEVIPRTNQGGNYRVITAQQVRGRHHRRQQKDSTAKASRNAGTSPFEGDFVLFDVCHAQGRLSDVARFVSAGAFATAAGQRASTLDPPATLSPTFTRSSEPC